MEAIAFALLVATCAPHVDIATARAIVAMESSFNPFAIGVVGGRLDRQPRSLDQALLVTRRLRSDGFDYSVGLAQINVRNFQRLGLSAQGAFDPCTSLSAMQSVLIECYERASRVIAAPQRALRLALSCYYSGNFTTGIVHGYVRRVARATEPITTNRLPSPT